MGSLLTSLNTSFQFKRFTTLHAMGDDKDQLIEIGPGFWNVRHSFKVLIGMVDIETHMSVIQLKNGNFLVVDTIPLKDNVKQQLDNLTTNGSKIEGVLGTHPFHTLAFSDFYKAYPNVPYYGTPRHISKCTDIQWAGDLNDCDTRNKWAPEVQMRIPAGAEFVNPQPESFNHFICVFVYHHQSRTLHVDDTLMYSPIPGFLVKMAFHPSMKGPGLYPTVEAPYQFRDWMRQILKDWDFNNICCAHIGNKIGGAKVLVQETLEKAESVFQKLSDKNKKKNPSNDEAHHSAISFNVKGEECG
ncbi:unnamed protein product [Didymodactylos carnosus]|uniref:Uncharacterized protein n=1 Tax=Didymodactylos carnosus TaxID=1234261 RepID=A0A8S2DNS3_9BILA|nr:unnamed protein product [Didymodactylos carnosus]CAF3764382.1 unnamed protein product [Didymodactylos carnosus]